MSDAELFESFVRRVLARMLPAGEVSIDPPTRTNTPDGGKDIVFHTKSSVDVVLFGLRLEPNSSYYVECKYSTDGNIGWDDVGKNVGQQYANIRLCRYILITNAYINPRALANIEENYPERCWYVNGELLKKFAEDRNVSIPNCLAFMKFRAKYGHDQVSIDYATTSTRTGGYPISYHYFSLYNSADAPTTLDLVAESCRDYSFSPIAPMGPQNAPWQAEWRKTITLGPNQTTAVKVVSKQAVASLSRETKRVDYMRFAVIVGRHVVPVIRQPSFSIHFRPPLFGSGRAHLVKSLAEAIDLAVDTQRISIFHLTGGAGFGKTRIIEDALAIIAARGLEQNISTVTVDAAKGPTSVGEWIKTVEPLLNQAGWAGSGERNTIEQILSNLIDACRRTYFQSILVIEDLHNASLALCQQILTILQDKRPVVGSLVLILTSRNDDSFVNRHFWALHGELTKRRPQENGKSANNNAVACRGIRLRSMKRASATRMVQTIVKNITPAGAERILRLSGNVPRNVIECIEYLLDITLVEIDAQNVTSIIDQHRFEERSETLPEGMVQLAQARFGFLATLGALGEAARVALAAAPLFGAYVPYRLLAVAAGSDCDPAILRNLLEERQYLRFSQEGTQPADNFTWAHENVRLFFEGLLTEYARDLCTHRFSKLEPTTATAYEGIIRKAALAIWRDPDLRRVLAPGAQAKVATIIGENAAAHQILQPMLDRIGGFESFSTLDVLSEYYDQIDFALPELVAGDAAAMRLAAKLLITKVYIGGYHMRLYYAEDAYRFAKKVLRRFKGTDKDRKWADFWLDQKLAHILMDSGFSGHAYERLLLLAATRNSIAEVADDDRVTFEVENCLRQLYTHRNFRALAIAHGENARQAAERTGDPALIGMGLGDLAMMYAFENPKECITWNQQSLDLCSGDGGTQRHAWHSQVSLIAARLPDLVKERQSLVEEANAAKEVNAACANAAYNSILPRLHLLSAVLTYLSAVDVGERSLRLTGSMKNGLDEADRQADQGLDACARYSIGQIAWQIHNLKGMIAARRGDLACATAHLWTAIQVLEKDGLLFLGSDATISAVPIVVANYFKLTRNHQVQEATLARINGYAPARQDLKDLRLQAMEAAEKYHSIFAHKKLPGVIADQATKLAIVAWF